MVEQFCLPMPDGIVDKLLKETCTQHTLKPPKHLVWSTVSEKPDLPTAVLPLAMALWGKLGGSRTNLHAPVASPQQPESWQEIHPACSVSTKDTANQCWSWIIMKCYCLWPWKCPWINVFRCESNPNIITVSLIAFFYFTMDIMVSALLPLISPTAQADLVVFPVCFWYGFPSWTFIIV